VTIEASFFSSRFMRHRLFILWWIALLGIMPAARGQSAPTAPVDVRAEADLAQNQDNLDLKHSLDVRHADLLQRFQAWNEQAQAYNSQYASRDLDPNSPEYAAGQAMLSRLSSDLSGYNNDNAAFAADVARLVPKPPPPPPPVPSRVNLYFDMRTLLAREEPKYDVSKIQAEIDGVRAALQRLEAVRENNAARIEEWQKESDKASHDALEMGANMSVDLLTSALKNRADAIDKQLQKEADLLAGETDPARRKEIQDTFKELNDHKEKLKKAQEAAEVAHEGVDRIDELDKATDGPEESEELQSTSQKVSKALEEAWEDCDKAGALPEGAKEAKQMVDAVYLTAVQVVAVGQINAANYDAEQYLKAVTSLSQQYKKLVDLKNAVEHQSPPPLIPPDKVILQRPID
jgi:hypothetical protein